MLDKLEQIETRYEDLTRDMSSPELLANPSEYGKAAKQHRSLGEVVQKYQSWKALKSEVVGARELFETSDDDEMRKWLVWNSSLCSHEETERNSESF